MDHLHTNCELIVFAKEPVAGQVKTRLSVTIGADRARRIYTVFLRDVLTRCSHPQSIWHTVVAVTPDSAIDRMQEIIPAGIEVRPQGDGGLGDRLRNAIGKSWEMGAHRSIAIGSDCLELTVQDIEQSFNALREKDSVLGPALDGGYYLIGFNHKVGDRLFALLRGIEWSTERVFQQTMDQIKGAGLSCAVLPERRDIDTESDLIALLKTCSPELKDAIVKQLANADDEY